MAIHLYIVGEPMSRQASGGPGRSGGPVRRQARRLSQITVAAGAAILVASTGTAAAGTAFAGSAFAGTAAQSGAPHRAGALARLSGTAPSGAH
jgi:hypothetical protein